MQFDLFDQEEARGPGERQCELEEMIAYEESLLAKVQAGNFDVALVSNGMWINKADQDDWIARAKAGEVIKVM